MFSLFSLDLDTALANHHSSKPTTTGASPRSLPAGGPAGGSLQPREGRGCTELLGGGSSAGCAGADVVVRGVAAQTHTQGAACRSQALDAIAWCRRGTT